MSRHRAWARVISRDAVHPTHQKAMRQRGHKQERDKERRDEGSDIGRRRRRLVVIVKGVLFPVRMVGRNRG